MSLAAWQWITHFGAAGAMLPVALVVALGLWIEGAGRSAGLWLLTLAAACVAVLGSKIAFAGWGVGLAALDFTGISGHAMLACAVLPVLLAWAFRGIPLPGPAPQWILAGLAAALVVGVSRVVLGAHSWSEVIAGWCVGAAAGAAAWRGLSAVAPAADGFRRWGPRLLLLPALGFMLSMNESMAAQVPAHRWEIQLALALSGREHPYRRPRPLVPPSLPRYFGAGTAAPGTASAAA